MQIFRNRHRCHRSHADLAVLRPAGEEGSRRPIDEDLSSRMLIALTSGLALWVLYGAVKADWIIIAANVVGTSLTGYVLYHKLHERQGVDEARLTPPKACGGSIPVEVANSPVGTNIWRPGAVVSKRLATTRKVPASIFALTPG